MAEDNRPKLVQIPQGRDSPHAVKSELEEEELLQHPKPPPFPSGSGNGSDSASGSSSGNANANGNGNGNTVTLPSFREAYGSALVNYPPQPPATLHDMGRPVPGLRPYPESPNSRHMGYSIAPSGPGSAGPSYRTSPHGYNQYGPPPPGSSGPPPVLHGPPAVSSGPAGLPGLSGLPGSAGPSPVHPGHERSDSYSRPFPPPESYHDSKEYYGYPQYGHYPDRPPPQGGYWAHQMPATYQPPPPETAPRQRTSIACKYCRKRKIRCSGYQNTPDGKCTNCKKTGNDCVFQPVSSTTSTAFVPVSAIQGGVPPGTPLYGAFGQPLGLNGGRGPSNPPPLHGYAPASPGQGGYYHANMSPVEHHGPPPQHMQHSQHQQYAQHPQYAQPPQHQQHQSHAPLPPMGPRQLPLPYAQSNNTGYASDDSRRLSMSKRTRVDEENEYPPRLRPLPPPPPPSSYGSQSQDVAYYRGPEDARRSPPTMQQSSGPAPSSESSSGSHAYGLPAPPVLPPLPPPPPMSSVGTDTSGRSSGSFSSWEAPSPTEWRGTSSPTDDTGDGTKRQRADSSCSCSPQYPQRTHEYDHSAGREDIDRTMLRRLASARPGPPPDSHAEHKSPLLLQERA